MIGGYNRVAVKLESERILKFRLVHQLHSLYVLHAERAHVKHPLWLFTKLYHALTILCARREMQRRHLCHGVAYRIVKRPFGNFSAMDMSHRDAVDKCCFGCHKYLVAVAKKHHDVGFQRRESLAHPL